MKLKKDDHEAAHYWASNPDTARDSEETLWAVRRSHLALEKELEKARANNAALQGGLEVVREERDRLAIDVCRLEGELFLLRKELESSRCDAKISTDNYLETQQEWAKEIAETKRLRALVPEAYREGYDAGTDACGALRYSGRWVSECFQESKVKAALEKAS